MLMMANRTFLASRAGAAVHRPEVRLRDIAASRASPNTAPTAPSPTRPGRLRGQTEEQTP